MLCSGACWHLAVSQLPCRSCYLKSLNDCVRGESTPCGRCAKGRHGAERCVEVSLPSALAWAHLLISSDSQSSRKKVWLIWTNGLSWHFRQAILANMRGTGEPIFECDFSPGYDMLGQIRQGPKPVERMEFELFSRLAVSIPLNHRIINDVAETRSASPRIRSPAKQSWILT